MGDVPPNVLIAWGFFTVVLAIAGMSWTLQRQRAEARRAAVALRVTLETPSVQAQAAYERAVEEALRRDPSLADPSDPGTVERLAREVAAIQEHWRLLEAVNVATAKREANERAEELRVVAEQQREERRRLHDERNAHLRTIPWWRRWWHANPILGTVLLIMVVGAGGLLIAGTFQSWSDARRKAEEREAYAERATEEREIQQERNALLREQAASCDASIPKADLVDPAATGRAWLTCPNGDARAAGLTLIGRDGLLAFEDHMKFAKDPDPRVRQALAGRTAVYGPAEEILAMDPDPAVREALAGTARGPKALQLLVDDLTEPLRVILLSRGSDLPEQIQRQLPPACVTSFVEGQMSVSGTVWQERVDREYVMGYRLNRDCTVDVQRWYRGSQGVDLDSQVWSQSGTSVTIGGTQWKLSDATMTSGSRVLSLVTRVKTGGFGEWSIS